MPREDIIAGIDVGSSTIRVAVGQIRPEGGLHIISASEAPSEGVHRGVVTSIEDAVSSVSRALEQAERVAGVPVERAAIGLNTNAIISQTCKGIVAVAKANREITQDDVNRALESAQTAVNQTNYDIIHVLPRTFTIDSQSGVKDPIGMTGLRLEVEAQIIMALQSQVNNLTKAIYRTGVDIDELVVSGLAAAESVVTKRQKELGVAVVNIGGATTSLVVLEEGDVVHTAVLPVGSGHITNDLAIGLRTSIDVAEQIKMAVGTASVDEVDPEEKVDLALFGQDESEEVSKKYIAEIIQARVEELYKMLDKELKAVHRSGLLPAGVVITGGGARLPGMVELGKELFRLPTSVGYPKVETAIGKIQDPLFATAVGLVQWHNNQNTDTRGTSALRGRFSSVDQVTSKMKGWFKSLIP